MNDREWDNLLEAQQVKQELEQHFDGICRTDKMVDALARVHKAEWVSHIEEIYRLTELVQVQREYIALLDIKMGQCVNPRYVTILEKKRYIELRKKIAELTVEVHDNE